MRRLLILAVLAIAMFVGTSPAADAGRWIARNPYDSLAVSTISTADTVKVAEWQVSEGGQVVMLIREISITTSDVEATFNVKGVVTELDGEETWIQLQYAEGSTARTAAIDLLGSDEIWIDISGPFTYYSLEMSRVHPSPIYVIITKNDGNAGFVDLFVWTKEDN